MKWLRWRRGNKRMRVFTDGAIRLDAGCSGLAAVAYDEAGQRVRGE